MAEDIEKIYKNYAKSVYRYLLSLTHDEDLAEELTEETFYRAVYSIHTYNGISPSVLRVYGRKYRAFHPVGIFLGLLSANREMSTGHGKLAPINNIPCIFFNIVIPLFPFDLVKIKITSRISEELQTK